MPATEKWKRIEFKKEFMNRFISNSILLNNGTASIFFGIAAANYETPSVFNIILLLMAAILVGNAAKATNADFERMKIHDVAKSERSKNIDKAVLSSMTSFKWVIIIGAITAILNQGLRLSELVSIECKATKTSLTCTFETLPGEGRA